MSNHSALTNGPSAATVRALSKVVAENATSNVRRTSGRFWALAAAVASKQDAREKRMGSSDGGCESGSVRYPLRPDARQDHLPAPGPAQVLRSARGPEG